MSIGYRIWIEDSKGRSSNVAYPDHTRHGLECFRVSENREFTIVLEHLSSGLRTYFIVAEDGGIEIEQDE